MSEIEIPLEEINKESGQETIEQPEQPEQQEPKQEIVKDISKLTLEERAKIISDARNGIPNEHYDVILLKNGNTRIVKKKIKTPSLSTRLIDQAQNKENNDQEKNKKVYMSDNQLMMEHIIELNNQVNKLMNKQKKLKKKYRSLKHDIYEDVELEQEVNKQDVKPEIKPEVKQETKPETNNQVNNQVQYKRKGWRSYVSYL